MLFTWAWAQSEMQTALAWVWTWITNFLSLDNNNYAKSRPWSNGNEGLLHIPLNLKGWSLTPSDAVWCHAWDIHTPHIYEIWMRKCKDITLIFLKNKSEWVCFAFLFLNFIIHSVFYFSSIPKYQFKADKKKKIFFFFFLDWYFFKFTMIVDADLKNFHKNKNVIKIIKIFNEIITY